MLAQPLPPTPSIILWRVRSLAIAFFMIFFAYSSAQTLESTLNGASGFACLSLIYCALSISFLCAPYIVSLFDEARLPALFFCAALPYVLMVSTKLLPRGLPGVQGISLLSCAGVGMGGGPLWSAQGFYISRATAATFAATPPSAAVTLSTISTRLNAAFFTISMMSGAASNTISTLILLSFKGDVVRAVAALFTLLTAVGAGGLLWFSTLPMPGQAGSGVWLLPFCLRASAPLPPPAAGKEAPTASLVQAHQQQQQQHQGAECLPLDGAGAAAGAPPAAPRRRASWVPWPEENAIAPSPALPTGSEDCTVPSPLYMLRFMLASREVRFMAPFSFVSGAGQGFVAGAWMAAAVADTVGASYVGIVGAAYCLSSALCSVAWGRLAQRPSFGRRSAFACAHVLLVAWYVINACAWWAGGMDKRAAALAVLQAGVLGGGAGAGAAQQQPSLPLPPATLIPLLITASLTFASVDPVQQALVSATMQVYFPVKPKVACAVAAPKFFYAIGFSLQQLLALTLSSSLGRPAIAEQCLLQAALVCISGASLWWLHTRVSPIDGTPLPAAPASPAAVGSAGSATDAAA